VSTSFARAALARFAAQTNVDRIIEQMHVIDTDHHRGARRRGSQRLDHPAHQLNGGVGDP